MSTKLSSYVWDGCASSGMKITSVAIMARLADFSSDEGKCWPSIKTISRQIGAGESTVRCAIRKLESEGWLSTQKRRKGNRNNSNIYQLNVEKLRLASKLSDSDASESSASKAPKTSIYQPSDSDASDFDVSNFEASKNERIERFDPPESGGDPLVSSKEDPSIKIYCQADELPDEPHDDESDPVLRVLNHFNRVTDSEFRDGATTRGFITGVLQGEYVADDLMLVVDYIANEWAGQDNMSFYLRPKTIFSQENFEGYFDQARAWRRNGKPQKIAEPAKVNIDLQNQDYSGKPRGFRT